MSPITLRRAVFVLCLVWTSALSQGKVSVTPRDELSVADELGKITADLDRAALRIDEHVKSTVDENQTKKLAEGQARRLNERLQALSIFETTLRKMADGAMIVAHSLAIVYQVPDKEKHLLQFNLREICSYSGGLSAFELSAVLDVHKKSGVLNKNDIEIVQDAVDTGSRHGARLRDVCSVEIDEITGNK